MACHPAAVRLAAAALSVAAGAGCTALEPGVASTAPSLPVTATTAVTATTTTTTTEPAPAACLPQFGPPEDLSDTTGPAEPFLSVGDFDGDGRPDFVVTRLRFQSADAFPVEVFLGGDDGRAARAHFVGDTTPTVQHPAERVIADFNGDDVDDVFVADTGQDRHPFPGFQSALVLSAPGGGLVDGTPGLPQQHDYTHSAEAADVDGDGDLDLYVGNVWGGAGGGVGPQIWLNDGTGVFTVAAGLLPQLIADRDLGAYLTEAFADLDGDGDADLVVGDAGDDLARGPSSEVLRNDGTGRFAVLPGALPPKHDPTDLVHDIEVADLDGDDHPDLVVVAQGSAGVSSLQVLRNTGDGRFEDATAAVLDQPDRRVWIPRIDLIDLDGDGDLDLIARPWDDRDPDPILWVNEDGSLRSTPHDFGLDYLYYDFADWDADGDSDIVQAEYGGGFTLLRAGPCR